MDTSSRLLCFLAICLGVWLKNVHTKNIDGLIDEHLENIVHSRKLRSAGFQEFEISALYEIDEDDIKTDFKGDNFRRRRRSSDDFIRFHFSAYGEDFNLVLKHKKSIVHSMAKIFITRGDKQVPWQGEHPDCFLTGGVTSHDDGTVSISYCNEMIGGLTTRDHVLHFEELPQHLKKRDVNSARTQVIVGRKTRNYYWDMLKDDPMPTPIKPNIDTKTKDNVRERRAIQDGDIEIELAVYTDAAYTALFPLTDTAKRIEMMGVKYHGVEMEWGRADQLNFNISFTIKYMEFFETNPAYYNTSTTVLSTMLSTFCSGKQGGDQYDHFYIHVGKQGLDVAGRAFQSSMCNQASNCACDNIAGLTEYVGTAHEIGHNLGMEHDDTLGCTAPNIGNMGSYGAGWSTCSANGLNTFLAGNDVTCLYTTNVPTVDPSVQSLTLVPELVGQTYSPDQVCELKYGSGFKFRRYPLIDFCLRHSCADHNPGSTYGQIFGEVYNIPGQYCDVGKICFKFFCETWATAKQENLTIQVGGWGAWGSWQECDRTCGRGVRFRRRNCDSPIAINLPGCDGNEYDAEACNTTACPGDSSDAATLKTQRATESCAILVDNGVISSGEFDRTGVRYSYQDDGQCEVSCNTLSNYTETNSYRRYGFMPQGTPCEGTLHDWDTKDWPRRPGYYFMCVDGLCRKFGCDDQYNGQQYDECGVCGGDNSTCNAIYGFDNITQGEDERREMLVLPVGAFNIQFWFTYSTMRHNYLEVYTKEGGIILASRIVSNFIYTTGDTPISFAGTYWTFSYNIQQLYAKGPLTEPAIIKIYQYRTFDNVGINYGYSVPLSVATCSGSCSNGGTYNNSMCACECPSGFTGNDCGTATTCTNPLVCFNDGVVDHATCTCNCTDRSYGSDCRTCKYAYTGEGCNTCKVSTCESCGTFNDSNCRCDCLQGYGGLQCDVACADISSTCAADAAAGKCESENNDMEVNCMATCGFCNSTTPMAQCGGSTLAIPTTAGTTPFTCPYLTFTCGNGNCAQYSQMCDGTDDCGNNKDEDTSNVLCGGKGSRLEIGLLTVLLIASTRWVIY